MKVFLVLAIAVLARAEPPVDSYGMQPPSRNAPSSTYGAPDNQFGGTPIRSNDYSSNGDYSNNNGHSSLTSARFTGFGQMSAPSSQYGAPAARTPNSQYGAPSARAPQQNQFGGQSQRMPSPVYGAPSDFNGYPGGRNNGYDDDMSEPASYEFKYEVNDDASGSEFGHQEEREGDVARGEYRVLLPDGRTQVVKYEADQDGYRPEITYIEADGPYGRGPANGRGGAGGPY